MTSVTYTWVTCGTFDRTVRVNKRRPDEDIAQWVRGVVVPAVSANHQTRAPWCLAKQIDKLMLPLAGEEAPK